MGLSVALRHGRGPDCGGIWAFCVGQAAAAAFAKVFGAFLQNTTPCLVQAGGKLLGRNLISGNDLFRLVAETGSRWCAGRTTQKESRTCQPIYPSMLFQPPSSQAQTKVDIASRQPRQAKTNATVAAATSPTAGESSRLTVDPSCEPCGSGSFFSSSGVLTNTIPSQSQLEAYRLAAFSGKPVSAAAAAADA